jgi:UDP-3-O-[3-hydroxymyristoyl] glucosamine N-acyltransferase
VGSGLDLQRALAAWRAQAPGIELRPVELPPRADRATLQALLGAIEALDATAFAAVDAYFLNFHRVEVMSHLRLRGIPMPPLVERGALVADDVKLSDNTWIGAGAIIQPGCRIGFNAVIGAGSIVGAGAEIGQSAWVDAGVTIGQGARIGAKATLGLGVIVGHGVQVGKLCVIDKPGRYDANIADKTFIQSSHAHPMVIVGA